MKIAAIGNFWYPEAGGGLDRYFFGMVRALAAEGDAVDFFTAGNPPDAVFGAHGTTLAPRDASLVRRFFSAARTLRRVDWRAYDVLNVHFTLYGLAALPSIPRDLPIVFHFHGPWDLESIAEGQSRIGASVKHLLERLMFRRATRFVTVSTAFADLLSSRYGIPRARIDVVPLGIDTRFFSPKDRAEARARLGWPQERFTVFTARRLIQRVGVRELVEAAALMQQPTRIVIAGAGPLESELAARIAAAGLEDRVSLLGFLPEPDLADAYAAADLVMLPSQALEGFGSVIAESLASGTPVLVTPVGGMPEYVRPLHPGLVTAGADAASIAVALDRWHASAAELPASSLCRDYALSRFDWTSVAARLRDVFGASAQPQVSRPLLSSSI